MALTGQAALAQLLKLQSPTNVGALSSRGLDIASGMEDFAPTESELGTMQEQDTLQSGPYGYSAPKEEYRADSMSKIKRMLGLGQIQHQQQLAEKTQPEIIKGEYGVRAAAEAAKAAEARRGANEAAMASRQDQMIAAIGGRQDKTIANQGALQEDQQAFKGGQVNATAMGAIARERQHLADEIRKGEPNALFKMFGRTNQRQGELDTFDAALGAAQKIASQFPQASAEEGLMNLGETELNPDEVGQVQKFLLMLRGH